MDLSQARQQCDAAERIEHEHNQAVQALRRTIEEHIMARRKLESTAAIGTSDERTTARAQLVVVHDVLAALAVELDDAKVLRQEANTAARAAREALVAMEEAEKRRWR